MTEELVATEAQSILIVEDDRETRAVITAMLSLGDYVIQVAEDRDRAMQVLKKFTPDLILVDICMPGMSIDQFIAMAATKKPAPKIALMSAYPLLQSECERLGVTNYLRKPFQVNTLIRAVKSWLKRDK